MFFLTFEEFNNKFNIDDNAMSDIRIKDIGKDISLTPIEIVMRDENPKTIRELNFNFIVNLHPTDGTHWVLIIRREDGRMAKHGQIPIYYFDSFGVETTSLFLKEYVDLGSNERIQQYDEFYCGAYCLYVIYLIDRGFRIKSALNILVNQVKCPERYNECFCLSCNVNANDNASDNVNDKDNDNDNDNDIDIDIDNDTDNDNDIDNDNDNDNINDLRSSFANNDNDNDLRSSFANNVNDNDNDRDNFIYLFGEKHQRGKPNNKECLSDNIYININEDLQSWLNDDNIITEATLPENFRCIISGPSECGKTFLLKKLILESI